MRSSENLVPKVLLGNAMRPKLLLRAVVLGRAAHAGAGGRGPPYHLPFRRFLCPVRRAQPKGCGYQKNHAAGRALPGATP